MTASTPNGEPKEALIRTSGLALGYADADIVREVNLEIRRGQFWFLIGPNGSGKTTLLRGLLGLLPVRRGTLELDPVRTGPAWLGFVPQHCEINPTLPTTVREFVSLGFVNSRVARAERPEALRTALERVGLKGAEATSYWSLSGGQRQRALVARALVRRPTLLVLDEPTEWLDIATEDVLMRVLAALNRDGMTLLLVTHKLELAAHFATHVALFDDGRVRAGPREELLTPETIERVFGVRVDLLGDGLGAPQGRPA